MAVKCLSKLSSPLFTFPITPINNCQWLVLIKLNIRNWRVFQYFIFSNFSLCHYCSHLHTIFSLPETFPFKLTFFLLVFSSLPSSLSFTPLTSLFYCTIILWLLIPHKKGGSVLPLLLKFLQVSTRRGAGGCGSSSLPFIGTPVHPQPVFPSGVPQRGSSFPSHLGVFQLVRVCYFHPDSRSKGDFGSADQMRIPWGNSHLLRLCPGEDYRLVQLGGQGAFWW